MKGLGQSTALGGSHYNDPSRIWAYAEELLGARRAPHPGWKRVALCAGDERFYDRDRATAAVIAHQRQICGACTVAADCLLDALAHERVQSGWQVSTRGGLLARERRYLTEGGR